MCVEIVEQSRKPDGLLTTSAALKGGEKNNDNRGQSLRKTESDALEMGVYFALATKYP
jgi:hypothetical protein